MDMIKNLKKKAQGLPLNTIVIAILVIIVMLVIIVFFTSKTGDSASTINDQTSTFKACSVDNPAIGTIYKFTSNTLDKDACSKAGGTVIPGVPGSTTGNVCCAKKDTAFN